LNVSFGYLTTDYDTDDLYLYTNGVKTYAYAKDLPVPNNKLYARWLYKNGLGQLVAVTEKNP
jgi:hypothetical protein